MKVMADGSRESFAVEGSLLFQIGRCYIAASGAIEAGCCRIRDNPAGTTEDKYAQLKTVIEPN
jgi:hypothetical protein